MTMRSLIRKTKYDPTINLNLSLDLIVQTYDYCNIKLFYMTMRDQLIFSYLPLQPFNHYHFILCMEQWWYESKDCNVDLQLLLWSSSFSESTKFSISFFFENDVYTEKRTPMIMFIVRGYHLMNEIHLKWKRKGKSDENDEKMFSLFELPLAPRNLKRRTFRGERSVTGMIRRSFLEASRLLHRHSCL